MSETDDARAARILRSAERGRNVFFLLALLVPALLLALFARQAHRLEEMGQIAQASANRTTARNVVAGVFLFFALFGMMNDWKAGRLRQFGAAELRDPATPRRNGVAALLVLAPLLLGIFAWHAQDAVSKGESRVPVVLAAILSVAVIGGTMAYALRGGAATIGERTGRILRVVAPLAVGVAVLRALAFFAGW